MLLHLGSDGNENLVEARDEVGFRGFQLNDSSLDVPFLGLGEDVLPQNSNSPPVNTALRSIRETILMLNLLRKQPRTENITLTCSEPSF
jgi:hypothetical protein